MPAIVKDLVGILKNGTFIPPTLYYLAVATHAGAALREYLEGTHKTPKEAIAMAKKNFDDAVAKAG